MYPDAQNQRSVPRFPAFDRPQSRELAPGPDQRTAAGGGLSVPDPASNLHVGPPSSRPQRERAPVTMATPVRTPAAPVPRRLGGSRSARCWGDPGLERTSGRRIRSPSSAQPAGNCSHKTGFARQGGKVGKRDGPSSQHPENLSVFFCLFSSVRFPLPVSSCMIGVVSSKDYNYRNPRR